jgi:hypothetical protein
MKHLIGSLALLYCFTVSAQPSSQLNPSSRPTPATQIIELPLDTSAAQPLLVWVSAPLPEPAPPTEGSSFTTIKKNLTPPFLLSLGATTTGYVLFDLVTGYRINHGATELRQVFGFNLPMDLALVGMLVGPSLGYAYTHQRRLGVLNSALRTSGALMVSRWMAVCLGRDCTFQDEGGVQTIGALGGVLWAGFTALDLALLYGKPKAPKKTSAPPTLSSPSKKPSGVAP